MADKGITTLTALTFNDRDISDPNSGFYPPQATSEQIEKIPSESKEIGEVLYDTTVGSLVLFSKTPEETEPSWKIIGGGGTGAFIAPSHSEDPAEGTNGQIYYNSNDGNPNTTEEAFRIYADGAWSYLGPRFYATLTATDASLATNLSINEWTAVQIGADNPIPQARGFARGSNILIYRGKYPITANVIFNFSFSCDIDNVLFDFALDQRNLGDDGVLSPVSNLVSTQKLFVSGVSTNVTYFNTIDLKYNDQLTIILKADTVCRVQATCGCFNITAI